MKKLTVATLAASSLLAFTAVQAQPFQTAGQDMKNAGHSTANATKDVAHGTEKGTKTAYHKTSHATKKGYHKTVNGTKHVAHKVDGTSSNPQ